MRAQTRRFKLQSLNGHRRLRMKSAFFRTALLGMTAILALLSESADAGTFKVLHSFAGGAGDGANPYGGVAVDQFGNFYVATDAGGAANKGALTFITNKGAATVVHSFTGSNGDGQNADGAPAVAYNTYVAGTTRYGGAYGCGTAYSYTLGSGTYTNA